jgi:chromate reductase
MRVLGISGSLRGDSHNTRLLLAAAELLPEDAELQLFEGLKQVEPFDQDDEGNPGPGVRRLRAALDGADAVLIATPEYNSSIPGVLKNALDWASRPTGRGALANKPAAVIGASPSMFGAVWAQAELRKVMKAAGSRVLDDELPVATAHEAFTDAGALAEPEAAATLERIVADLAAAARERQELAAAA